MPVRIEQKEHVTTVIIDRIDARNAVDEPTAEALMQALWGLRRIPMPERRCSGEPVVHSARARRSAYDSLGLDLRDAMIREWTGGVESFAAEGAAGAGRFAQGRGRSADFADI